MSGPPPTGPETTHEQRVGAATVSAGARLHIGFQNLSLARERLYGGIGIGLAQPRVTVTAEPTTEVLAPDPLLTRYATRAVEILEVPGVSLTITEQLPRHVGLGSGTQLALVVLAATAAAYGKQWEIRTHAPAMGRGGRSGVGVGTFEHGGLVVDGGHLTDQFTTEPPREGEWTVPPIIAHHELPADWRFLVVVPTAAPGRSGDHEDASMRSIVEQADPAVADEIACLLTRKLLPAAATGNREAFGDAVAAIGHKNGTWYAHTQGGVFRPPAGDIVTTLEQSPLLSGVGQSSWGPTVYAVTEKRHEAAAVKTAEACLTDHGLEGTVYCVPAATAGVRMETCHNS